MSLNCWTQSYITLDNKDAQKVLEKLIEGDYYSKQFKLISTELDILKEINSNLEQRNMLFMGIHEKDNLLIRSKDDKYRDLNEFFIKNQKELKKKNRKKTILIISSSIFAGIITGYVLAH